MPNSTSEQLHFPPIPGFTVRVDFEGGTLSLDFGPLLLRGVDQQIGLTHRLAQAFEDKCPYHLSISHDVIKRRQRKVILQASLQATQPPA
jgi:hypothetical protein